MHPITTKGYIYKTDLHSIFTKTQKRKLEKIKDNNETKKRQEYEGPKQNNKNMMSFEKVLLESIDEALSILGDSGKQVVYSYLEKSLKINRGDIPDRMEEFTGAIEDIFKTGAKIIEIQIMKCLFKRVGNLYENKLEQTDFSFLEYVARIRKEKENQQ